MSENKGQKILDAINEYYDKQSSLDELRDISKHNKIVKDFINFQEESDFLDMVRTGIFAMIKEYVDFSYFLYQQHKHLFPEIILKNGNKSGFNERERDDFVWCMLNNKMHKNIYCVKDVLNLHLRISCSKYFNKKDLDERNCMDFDQIGVARRFLEKNGHHEEIGSLLELGYQFGFQVEINFIPDKENS